MELREITIEQIEKYKEVLDPDEAENIGRDYYCALALHAQPDVPAQATLIWQLKNVHKEQPTIAEVTWFYAADPASGKELLAEFEKRAGESGACGISFEFKGDKSDATSAIFAEAGYLLKDTQSSELVITVKELSHLAIKSKDEFPAQVTSISRLSMRQFKQGIRNCLYNERNGTLEDLDFLPLDWFEPELSCCVQMNFKVNGYLLVHKQTSGRLAVKLLFACKPASSQDLLHMIRFASTTALEHYPPQTPVVIRHCDEATRALVTKLFPKAQRAASVTAQKKL